MNDRKRWVGYAGLAIVVAVVAWYGWRAWTAGEPVDLGTVTRGSLEVTLDHEGKTRVRDRFVVSAPLAGRLLRIELEPGDPVVAGETVVATFLAADPTPLDSRTRAEATARIKAAEAALERSVADQQRSDTATKFSRRELERAVELFDDGVVSRQQLERFESEERAATQATRAAQASVQAARFELEVAKAALLAIGRGSGPRTEKNEFELTSPIDGVVLRRIRESEGVVAAGEPLLEIADRTQLEIVADYLSSDAVRIRPGMSARIDRWGGDEALEGRVRRVNPAGYTKVSALGVEEQRVDVIVDLLDPAAAPQLGDDFRVETRITIEERRETLRVPAAALFRTPTGWAAFSNDGGTARLRKVEIGLRGQRSVEVLSGLDEGDEVVLHPTDSLEDGVRISPREA